MIINCNTKGCMKTTEAKLDLTTNEVICEECGNPIGNLTEFLKRTLKSIGQVIKSEKKTAFQSMCINCKKNQPLKIKGRTVFCTVCDHQVFVSDAFFSGLKNFLTSQDEDDVEEEVEEKVEKKVVKKTTKKSKGK